MEGRAGGTRRLHVPHPMGRHPTLCRGAPVSEIPYEEMRRLCGLPDIEHLDLMALIRKHGLNQAISFMQLTGTFQQQEDGRIQWTPDPSPWWVPVDRPSIESTQWTYGRRTGSTGGFLGGRKPEVATPLPKPSTSPPMWANNPARTRRTTFKPTRRVK